MSCLTCRRSRPPEKHDAIDPEATIVGQRRCSTMLEPQRRLSKEQINRLQPMTAVATRRNSEEVKEKPAPDSTAQRKKTAVFDPKSFEGLKEGGGESLSEGSMAIGMGRNERKGSGSGGPQRRKSSLSAAISAGRRKSSMMVQATRKASSLLATAVSEDLRRVSKEIDKAAETVVNRVTQTEGRVSRMEPGENEVQAFGHEGTLVSGSFFLKPASAKSDRFDNEFNFFEALHGGTRC